MSGNGPGWALTMADLTVDRCCEQCLGALAESAVRNADVATAAAIAGVFVETLNVPEDGWMFEARQGCAA